MSQTDRLEIENEILELELRLKSARSRLQEAHGNVAYEESPEPSFTDSMLTLFSNRSRTSK
jgi:urease accessory protein